MKSLLEKLQAKEKRGLKLQQDKEEGRKKLKPSKKLPAKEESGKDSFLANLKQIRAKENSAKKNKAGGKDLNVPKEAALGAEEGMDKEGMDKEGMDKEGMDKEGMDKEGMDKEGMDKEGMDKEGMDKEGMGKEGMDKQDMDKEGVNKEESGITKDRQ